MAEGHASQEDKEMHVLLIDQFKNSAVINDLRIEIIDKIVAKSVNRQDKKYDLSTAEDRTLKKYDDINERIREMKREFGEKKRTNMKSESFKLPSLDSSGAQPCQSSVEK